MIRPLRRRHRIIFTLLAALLPAGYAAALLVRPPATVPAAIPAALLDDGAAAGAAAMGGAPRHLWVRDDLWGELPIRTALLAAGDGAGATPTGGPALEVTLRPLDELRQPDVLVYWTESLPGVAAGGNVLAGASLMGTLAGALRHRYRLPAVASPRRPGALLLYSLAHQELIGAAVLPPVAGSTGGGKAPGGGTGGGKAAAGGSGGDEEQEQRQGGQP